MNQTIVLLFGGESNERLVSCASAQAMAEALAPQHIWFWHKDGAIFQVSYDELSAHEEPFTNEFKPLSSPIFASIKDAITSDVAQDRTFVLAVHGGSGENGTLQALFEEAHIAYTGSDATTSKLAFDKLRTKKALQSFPIKLAEQKLMNGKERALLTREIADFFTTYQACIAKPVCGGSSLGCHFITAFDQIESVVEDILKTDDAYFLEQLILGRELTVGVFDSEQGCVALPVTEIVVDHSRNFDYEGKYLGHGTKELTPADLSERQTLEAQRLAIAAHTALGLFGYSRTDMIMGSDGMYFLEINTLPGMSKQSLIPQQLALAGVSLADFLKRQIKLAEQRLKSRAA